MGQSRLTFGTVLRTVALVLAMLVAVGLLISLATVAFLGLGSLFGHFFELTLFEATTVTLLGVITLVLVVHLVSALFLPTRGDEYEDWVEEDEEDWYDEDWDEDRDEEDQHPRASALPTFRARGSEPEDDIFAGVGRNDPCPCGSGEKFKYCHGRIRRR